MTKKSQKKNSQINLDCPVRDTSGKKVDTISLKSRLFDGEVNLPLLQQVVLMYQANQRSGTASCKTRAHVSGGGKKPWRQKGTGRARTGSIRNPLWRGGGVIFGPHPRDFSYTLPQKLKKKALKSSLNEKLLAKNLIIVNAIKLEGPKTKKFSSILELLGIKDRESAIVIIQDLDINIKLASRNIPNISIKTFNNINAMDVLRHNKLIIQQSALNSLMRSLQ
ncbi:MAG: 50S ribosomal protein L4 [Candidatus Omnitrophica bacterium]|nr:50S ribosomal protein L4 [Candidatus Omnitrophota bacterium]